jgi:glycosyltransferase involved in cell wall biosynthesis
MRIGIDLGIVRPEETGGIWQVIKGIVEVMCTTHDTHSYVVFGTTSHQSLADSLRSRAKVLPLPPDQFYMCVDQLAHDEHIDVLFRSYPVEDDLVFPLARQIVLIPDVQHEEVSHFFEPETLRSRRAAFARALSGAGAIGTISLFSREKLLGRPETKCTDVFLMGPALPREHSRDARHGLTREELALIPQDAYFIYPANLWPHKNHHRILQAFGEFLKSTGRQMELVLTGHQDGWSELRDAFPGLPVRHLGYVQPRLLRLLIERAAALIFFSLYEGFGIPLLEAFNVGTPVLCSNTTSLPEIGGDAVLSCDPMNIEAMTLLMRDVVEDPDLRNRLAPKGAARLSQFSWDQSAANLIAACERVAAKPFVLSYDTVLESTQRLRQRLQASDEDRAARLAVIERLDAQVTLLREGLAAEPEPALPVKICDRARSLSRRIGDRFVKWISSGRG